MRVIWPMKPCEMWNKSKIILGCAEKKRLCLRIRYRYIVHPIAFSKQTDTFYAPAASVRRGLRAFGLSVRAYVRTSVRPSVDQVKIFVQSRISRPINGSKLICHMRMYLFETSRNIQEPWPHDLYFTVHWLRTLARLSRLRWFSKVESQDLSMVASWYFIWRCISMRPAGINKSHDLLTYILQSTDFVLWPDYQG